MHLIAQFGSVCYFAPTDWSDQPDSSAKAQASEPLVRMDQTPEAENQINWAKYMNSFWLLEDYIFANDFLRFFDRSFQKNVKGHVF